MTCPHTISQGRDGSEGSWCIECGVKILEVHDRPCRECRHYKPDGERVGICQRYTMRVTAEMKVTYWLVDGRGRHGLCFEKSASS